MDCSFPFPVDYDLKLSAHVALVTEIATFLVQEQVRRESLLIATLTLIIYDQDEYVGEGVELIRDLGVAWNSFY